MDKYCANCGSRNDEDDTFCSSCGKPLKNTKPRAERVERTKTKDKGISNGRVIGIVIGLVIFFVIVGALIAGNNGAPKETLIQNISVSSLPQLSVFGNQGIIIDIPSNATNLRVDYNLTGSSSYGIGSNGNLGATTDKINNNSGQSPIGPDNLYLEAGPGKSISGEKNFTDKGSFYYEGNFQSGNILVYVTS